MSKIELNRIDLNLLVTFEVLLEERHVGRAAARLNVSQSAVSHALGRLRELFNDPLFVRHPKGIEPTKVCSALGAAVTDVLDRTRAVLESGPPFDPKRPHRFTIGLTDASVSILVALLERMRQRWPKISLQVLLVDSSAVVGSIDRQDVDLAFSISSSTPVPKRIEQVTALALRYVALRHRRSDSPATKFRTEEDFLALPHLAISPRGEATTLIDDLLAEVGLKRNVVLTVPYFLAAPMIVARTDLVAIIDNSIAQLFSPDMDLETIELPINFPRVTIDILSAAARTDDQALKWLRQECLAACREMSADDPEIAS